MKLTRFFCLNHWLNPDRRTKVFLGGVLGLTLFAVYEVSSTLVIIPETFVFSMLWVAGFGFLFFNVAYLFLLSIAHFFIREPVLNEVEITHCPKTALVYPVRNENHGLLERISYSFSGNNLLNTDLWILSDSSEEFIEYEKELLRNLQARYPGKVFYRRREVPIERKQGNIAEFLNTHPEYQYIYIGDADSMVPEGVLLKLLQKAEHPDNRDIAIFQSSVRIAHAETWYARFEKIGTYFAQRFTFSAIQAVFGESISFGHHHLARTEALKKLCLPSGLLSHDNWDTVLLREMGYRVVFCPDVFAYDEAPSNYLESRERSKRWAQGTLQGWPLIFKPVSLAARFLAFYGIYLYLSDLVFFFWVIFGILVHCELTGELIHFEIDSIWFGLCTNDTLLTVFFFSMGVVFFHKLAILKSWKDLREYLYELGMSTLITLNNFVYVPLDILSIPLRKLHWKPMAKNPFAEVSFLTAVKSLWIGTAFGLFGVYFCLNYTAYFVWQAAFILASLVFSIPSVYLSAQTVPLGWRNWI